MMEFLRSRPAKKALAATLGMTLLAGCSGQAGETSPTQSSKPETTGAPAAPNYHATMAEIARRISTLYDRQPASRQYSGKPPYTLAFTLPGLQPEYIVTFSAQFASANHDPESVTQLDVQEQLAATGKSVNDVLMISLTDGNWNAYCRTDDPLPVDNLSELEQKTVIQGASERQNPGEALRVLQTAVTTTDALVHTVEMGAASLPISNGLCLEER